MPASRLSPNPRSQRPSSGAAGSGVGDTSAFPAAQGMARTPLGRPGPCAGRRAEKAHHNARHVEQDASGREMVHDPAKNVRLVVASFHRQQARMHPENCPSILRGTGIGGSVPSCQRARWRFRNAWVEGNLVFSRWLISVHTPDLEEHAQPHSYHKKYGLHGSIESFRVGPRV